MEKKILLFIKIPPPITGATLMNKAVLDSTLLNNNFEIHSITISYSRNVSDLGKLKVSKFFVFIKAIFSLIKELSLFSPDLVYFQISPTGLVFYRDLLFVSIIKLFGTKVLFHLHGKGIKEKAKSKFDKTLYEYAFYKSKIICVSSLLTNDIKDVFNGEYFVVNNGVPDVDKKLIKLEVNYNSVAKILFISNLKIFKGIIVFLDSLQIIKKKKYDFEGLIVGAEADLNKEQLQKEIDKRGLQDRVKYLGFLFGNNKMKVISGIDIIVFPTLSDIWGNVILEAMQFGKPVIATREGAIPEIIDDGINGFLVEKNNPSQIAEKLKILIKDPELRINMGKAGRKKYEEKYTLEIFEKNLLNVFNSVLMNDN